MLSFTSFPSFDELRQLQNYLVLSLQTGGPDPETDPIRCLGMLRVEGREIVNRSHTYLDPEAVPVGDTTPVLRPERLAASLSVSPSALANRLRLLKLSPRVREAVRLGGLTERHARALLGPERVHEIDAPTMTTEDFGYFLEQRPGSFYHIGAGCELPLHNTGFLPTDEAVLTAAAVHAAVLEAFLEQ